MKSNYKYMTRIISFCAVFALHSSMALATVTSNFDDGTFQGWTKGTPFFNPLFGGDLALSSIGNFGNSLIATDTMGKGGGLFAQAPEAFTGDLTSFSNINWDEYLPSNSIIRTSVAILGGNNTLYTGITVDQNVLAIAEWKNRLIPFDFDSGLWSLQMGTDSFENVLSNVEGLYIQMDVSQINFISLPEARIDNVTLATVPVPAAVIFYCSGLIGLLGCSNRSRKTQSLVLCQRSNDG